jgi:Tfp pilus assembly protein PilV
MLARLAREDGGESLLEVLVALVIVGIAVVAVIGGLLTSVSVSDSHRKQASAAAFARNYAENVTTFVAGGGYSPCSSTAAYTPSVVGFSVPSGFSATTVLVRYWINGAWTTSGCTATTDTGVQQVTVQVASPDGRASEQLVVVVRKPCGVGSSCT